MLADYCGEPLRKEKGLIERLASSVVRRRIQRADRVIEELYDQIIEQKPADCDGVVIDVKARDWKYGNYCLVDALVSTMKHPKHSYVRQVFTDQEWDEIGRELGLYTS
jgi:hypothetical protein